MNVYTQSELFSDIDKEILQNGVNDVVGIHIYSMFSNIDDRLDHFIKNYKEDLSYYKQNSRSGYTILCLYKNTTMIYSCDFRSKRSREILNLNETKIWHINSYDILIRNIAKKYFNDIYDNRTRYSEYKPTVYRFIDDHYDIMFAEYINSAIIQPRHIVT